MRCIFTIYFTVFLTFSVLAETLSLSEYLSIVSEKNISIKIKENEQATKEYDTYQAYSAFLPKADLKMNYIYSELIEDNKDNMIYAQSDLRNPVWGRYFEAVFPIFLGGSRYFRLKIAEKNEKIGEIDIEYEKLRVKAEAVSYFVSAFAAQENTLVSKQGIELAQENYKLGQVLRDSGRTTDLALLNFQLSLENRNQELSSFLNEISKSFAKMSQLANKDIKDKELVIDEDIDKIADFFEKCENESCSEKYVSEALKNSPVIKKIRNTYEISEDSLMLSLSPFFPAVSFSYKHDFGSAEKPFEQTFAKETDLSRYKNNLYILSFSWNVFNGFSDTINYKKAKAQQTSANLALLETENQIKSSVKSIISTISTSLKQRKVAKLAHEISEKTIEKTKNEFNAGKVTYIELLNAESAFLQAKKNIILIDCAILNSYYQLLLLIGKPVME